MGKHYRGGEVSEKRAAWVFLAPSLILFFGTILYPIIFTLYLSFTDWDGIGDFPLPICYLNPEFSCFDNYKLLIDDYVFWLSAKNNLVWIALFCLSPFVGLFLALFFHIRGRFIALYKSLLFLPMVFSLVVVGLIWSWFFQPEFGLVEFIFKKIGLLNQDDYFTLMSSFNFANLGLIIAASWPHAAYCMILFLAGISNLQRNVIEAALIDGVSRWQLLWHVVFPMLKPATIIVSIVTMIGALRTFEIVAIMTGGGPANSSNVLANYMFQQTFQNFRYGYGAAVAVVLFFISLGLIFAYLRQSWKEV